MSARTSPPFPRGEGRSGGLGLSPRRKVAYVAVDHLAVAVERGRRPDLTAPVVVIGGEPHERKNVYDVSTAGTRLGIRAGMPLRQAQQLAPDAVFLPSDLAAYESARESLLDLLETFSPTVEWDGRDGAWFDALGLERLFGPDKVLAGKVVAQVRSRLGFNSRVGVAPGRFVARLAARYALKEPAIVTPEGVGRFLERQPLAALPLDAEGRTRLERLGIRTVGEFGRLPAKDISFQLGVGAVRAHRLARGLDDAPLAPRPRPRTLRASRQFEPPLVDAEQLRAVVGRLAGELAAALREEGRAGSTLTLRLEGEAGEVAERARQLTAPTVDERALRRAAVEMAEPSVPAAASVPVAVSVPALKGRGMVRGRPEGRTDSAPFTARSSIPLPFRAGTEARTAGTEAAGTEERAGTEVAGTEDGPTDFPPITAVELIVAGLGAGVVEQLGLFEAQRRRRADLDVALGQIERQVGPGRMKRIVVADEDAWLPSRRYAFQDYEAGSPGSDRDRRRGPR